MLNVTFDMAILDLISRVHLASLAIGLPRYLKYYTFPSLCISRLSENEVLRSMFGRERGEWERERRDRVNCLEGAS